MANKKRPITDADRNAAVRLKSLWDAKKKALGLTQEDFAEQHEWTQANVSHYLLGRMALNRQAVLFFATALHEDPKDIYPELFKDITLCAVIPDKEFMDAWNSITAYQRGLVKQMVVDMAERASSTET